MTTEFFKGCQTSNEVRKRYYDLAMKNHPDAGGNTEVMQKINAEYETASKWALKQKQTNFKTKEEYEFSEEQQDYQWGMSQEFRDIIEKIIHLRHCKIEICGVFIYITGDTKPYAEYLGGKWYLLETGKYTKLDNGIGFKWSGKDKNWSWHPVSWVKKSNAKWTMQEKYNTFGREEVETIRQKDIN